MLSYRRPAYGTFLLMLFFSLKLAFELAFENPFVLPENDSRLERVRLLVCPTFAFDSKQAT